MADQPPKRAVEQAALTPRDTIRKRIKNFGFERVAAEAGIKASQTIMRYCDGLAVRPSTESLILNALESLEANRIRQDRKINEDVNENLVVVPMSKFNELQQQVEALSGQFSMLMKTQLAAHRWVNSEKAANILNCSPITLHRKKKAGELEYQMQGSRVAYSIDSLIQSLEKKHIKPEAIQQRVMSVLLS